MVLTLNSKLTENHTCVEDCHPRVKANTREDLLCSLYTSNYLLWSATGRASWRGWQRHTILGICVTSGGAAGG